jgi:hypothetical protein
MPQPKSVLTPMFGLFLRYAHDLEKRQQAVRAGTIKKLPPSETYSSRPKLPFTPQDHDAAFPGGISSASLDAPPAYTVSEATEMVGGSGGPGGHLGYASAHEQDLKKRKVPPIPASRS